MSASRPLADLRDGGSKGKAFQRVARYGQGWFAPTTRSQDLEPMLEKLGEACAEEGRDVSDIEITAMWIPAMEGVESVSRYRDLGVERLILLLAQYVMSEQFGQLISPVGAPWIIRIQCLAQWLLRVDAT